MSRRFAPLVALLLLTGCGGTQPPPIKRPAVVVVTEPTAPTLVEPSEPPPPEPKGVPQPKPRGPRPPQVDPAAEKAAIE